MLYDVIYDYQNREINNISYNSYNSSNLDLVDKYNNIDHNINTNTNANNTFHY